MKKLLVFLLCVPLGGCLTLQQVSTDIQTFFQTANADLAAACQSFQNSCVAIQAAAAASSSLVCSAKGSPQANKAAAQAQAIVTSLCTSQCPTTSNALSQASIQVTQAYSAYKTAVSSCGAQ